MAVYQIKKRRGFFSSLSLTTQLIVINLALYLVGIILLSIYGEQFILDYVALTPSMILSGKSLWTILTSMFMHGGFFHIFANMFSLFFIGSFLERIIGRKRFFFVYMLSGIVGGLFYILGAMLLGGLDIPAVGASGAIFGLLGVLAVLVPYSKVYLIAGPLIIIVLEVLLGPFLPSNILPVFNFFINFLIILMIFSLFSFKRSFRKIAVPVELPMWLLPIVAIVPLTIIGLFVQLPIGNSAHIGGLVAGLLYALYLKSKFPNKTKSISKMFK